jgi:streptomycin 6-kinase
VTADPRVPELGDELRRRLRRRFGTAVESWLDELPPLLTALAARWQIGLESVIQRGSMSVVMRCRTADGSPAVLKISPDRRRVEDEAAALACWPTFHVPALLAVDVDGGALLIEAIEPGTSLDQSHAYPRLDAVAALMTSLHRDGPPHPAYRRVAQRVSYLYEAGRKNYDRRPDLAAVISPELYERGRQLAMRLASETSGAVLLHGDLTPANILDGGHERGLVAIDPAPCLGDPAFDAVDLLLWHAEDMKTITARTEHLARACGLPARRLLAWCAAFAAMNALELAEASDDTRRAVDVLVALARAET